MRTNNPAKAISYLRDNLEGRLRSFSGSFSSMNNIMMRDFLGLFKGMYSRILNENQIEETLLMADHIFKDSASRLTVLLSTFGDYMEEQARLLKSKNTELREKEITRELVRRAKERIELIARTEVPWLSSSLKEYLAIEEGYEYFVWHTKKDKRVGEDHKILEGAIFRMDDLPIQGFPQRSRPNCRCLANFVRGIPDTQYKIIKQRQEERGIEYAN